VIGLRLFNSSHNKTIEECGPKRRTNHLSSRADCVGERSEPTHAVEGPCVFLEALGNM